jgi:hypothetical protein
MPGWCIADHVRFLIGWYTDGARLKYMESPLAGGGFRVTGKEMRRHNLLMRALTSLCFLVQAFRFIAFSLAEQR